MSFTTLTTTQTTFLETYLRGTGKTLTAADFDSHEIACDFQIHLEQPCISVTQWQPLM